MASISGSLAFWENACLGAGLSLLCCRVAVCFEVNPGMSGVAHLQTLYMILYRKQLHW